MLPMRTSILFGTTIMQINAIVSMYQKISGLDSSQQTEKPNNTQPIAAATPATSQGISNHYDLNNLSPSELESIIQTVDNGKQLSDQNTMMFSLQRHYLEQFGLKY